jgi:hypothetical protein
MHRHVRERKIKSTGGSGKESILGVVERRTVDQIGRIKTSHEIESGSAPTLRNFTFATSLGSAISAGL